MLLICLKRCIFTVDNELFERCCFAECPESPYVEEIQRSFISDSNLHACSAVAMVRWVPSAPCSLRGSWARASWTPPAPSPCRWGACVAPSPLPLRKGDTIRYTRPARVGERRTETCRVPRAALPVSSLPAVSASFSSRANPDLPNSTPIRWWNRRFWNRRLQSRMPGSEVCAAPIATERPDCGSHAKVASQQGSRMGCSAVPAAPHCSNDLVASLRRPGPLIWPRGFAVVLRALHRFAPSAEFSCGQASLPADRCAAPLAPLNHSPRRSCQL